MNHGHVKDFLSPNLPDWEMGVLIWNNRMVWGQVWPLHGFMLLAGPSPQESHVASSVQGIKIIKTMGMSGIVETEGDRSTEFCLFNYL